MQCVPSIKTESSEGYDTENGKASMQLEKIAKKVRRSVTIPRTVRPACNKESLVTASQNLRVTIPRTVRPACNPRNFMMKSWAISYDTENGKASMQSVCLDYLCMHVRSYDTENGKASMQLKLLHCTTSLSKLRYRER